MTAYILHGDCLDILPKMDAESIDSLVTDPPAGISFMGKEWDGDKGGRDAWVAWMTDVMRECLRVLKPGAHGLVWALPRTAHWTATALEDAGFEVRDCVTHLFGTGFPKSRDLGKDMDKAAGAEREVIGTKKAVNTCGDHKSGTGGWGSGIAKARETIDLPITAPATDAAKQWQGWGTALKPACEFWWLVRKPLSEKTVAANVLRWGTGGLNIDGCRIGTERRVVEPTGTRIDQCEGRDPKKFASWQAKQQPKEVTGRFPANLVLDEEAAAALDEQSGVSKSTGGKAGGKLGGNGKYGAFESMERANAGGLGDSGGASRFFYVAKASKKDRGEGNTHPTVKSTALMSYLVKLVTPPGGLVLDPFMGSGSTGVAATREGMQFVGIERELDYARVAEARCL